MDIRIKYGGHVPSTAAMTTLSMAVSVAVVTLRVAQVVSGFPEIKTKGPARGNASGVV